MFICNIYMLTPPHDRPPWGRGRVVSVPKHDLSTDWRQSPLPNSIPKFLGSLHVHATLLVLILILIFISVLTQSCS